MTRKSHLNKGQDAEKLACQYLQDNGLTIMKRNYSCNKGEIDLIMQEHETIVFTEVRFRSSTFFGSGAETVNYKKQKKLIATALRYLQQGNLASRPCRFDVISITVKAGINDIQWIRDAFQT